MKPLFSKKKHRSSQNFWFSILKNLPFIHRIFTDKEFALICFFCFLFFILGIRLFWLQVIKHKEYDQQLSRLHYKESLLNPERGNIFWIDKGGHPVQLTENISLYDLALDPKDLTLFPEKRDPNTKEIITPERPMKPRFIELIVPIIYKHLCEINGMQVPTKAECVKNIELFAGVDLLPKKPDLFYFGSGEKSPAYQTFDLTGYTENFEKTVAQFTEQRAKELITTRLNEKIQIWIKTSNYLGYFTEPRFLEEAKQLNLPYLSIERENYLYIIPGRIENRTQAIQQIKTLLEKRRYPIGPNFWSLFEYQKRRYIKLASGLNPELAQEVRELKTEHQNEKSKKDKERSIWIPVLYGLILEPYTTRYYPYGEFMSNILGYVNKKGIAYYGIEQYFDDILKGKKGEVKGRSSWMAGNVGTNEFEITHPVDGDDIYLTIDLGLQREAEKLAEEQVKNLKADAISILVLDTEKGEVKASVNAPTFNPNSYNDAYTLVPLWEEFATIIDDLTYIDIPVYIFTGNDYKVATIEERQNTGLQKFLNSNIFWPQVFVDKNISSPFEPWSIFKAFTVAIGIDTDEITYEDKYMDEGFVKVGVQTIRNASKICEGNNSFLHSLIYSCNVWMVKIVQKIQKYAFFNYLTKLWFWEATEIELAGEREGFVDNVNVISVARFLNNAFGQGLTTTQIQLASAYASLVNWGYYIKPTIISKIINKEIKKKADENERTNTLQTRKKIFKEETSELLKQGLREVMNHNPEISTTANIKEVKLGAKSWTAQISFRWKYQRGEGRTNGTFAGVISVDNPKYVVLIWVRRPRKSQWWGFTAGPIFKQIASYLLTYDM